MNTSAADNKMVAGEPTSCFYRSSSTDPKQYVRGYYRALSPAEVLCNYLRWASSVAFDFAGCKADFVQLIAAIKAKENRRAHRLRRASSANLARFQQTVDEQKRKERSSWDDGQLRIVGSWKDWLGALECWRQAIYSIFEKVFSFIWSFFLMLTQKSWEMHALTGPPGKYHLLELWLAFDIRQKIEQTFGSDQIPYPFMIVSQNRACSPRFRVPYRRPRDRRKASWLNCNREHAT